LAATHADFGRFPSAIEHGHEAIRIAERAQHPRSTVWAHYALGWAHSVRGDFLEALTVLERARAMVEEWEVFVMEPVVWGALGYAYARTGRLSEGLELLKRAGAPRQATGRITRPYVVLWLAEAYLLAGQLEEAHRSAQSALQEMRALGHGRDEAHALRLLGEITFQRDPGGAEAAEDLYRGAIARAEVSEMRPLVAQCQLGLGMLYTRTGAHERAGQHLTTARTMFQDMRLPFWLDRTEAALKDSPG
jgi:tetratricopeptide (TPR) repeat protein